MFIEFRIGVFEVELSIDINRRRYYALRSIYDGVVIGYETSIEKPRIRCVHDRWYDEIDKAEYKTALAAC